MPGLCAGSWILLDPLAWPGRRDNQSTRAIVQTNGCLQFAVLVSAIDALQNSRRGSRSHALCSGMVYERELHHAQACAITERCLRVAAPAQRKQRDSNGQCR